MRVLMNVWGFGLGGAERVAILLANALAELGCEVRLSTSVAEGHARSGLKPAVELKLASSKGQWAALRAIRAEIIDFRPDVVISHQTPRNVLSILAHLSSAGRRERVVVCVEHGEMAYNSRQAGLARRVMYQLAKPLYPLADLIVSVSENIRKEARRYVSPLPIRDAVLNNPVIDDEAVRIRALEPTAVFQDHDQPLIIGMGRLADQKNWPLALAAFARLQERRPSRLVIFGEGSERAKLERLIEEGGLADRVRLPGTTSRAFAEMRAADVLLLSSKWEGLPTVAIEALFCGLQVVSTPNSSGVLDILDHGRLGWVVDEPTPEALADALLQAIDNPRPRELLTQHAARYRDVTAAQAYLDTFSRLLDVKRGRATVKAEPARG